MKREELLLSRLVEYGNSNAYPLHMPGHKRMVEDAAFCEFPNPFAIDITEIEGFDNLHHPEAILKESLEWAAGVYGADQTYYLVNGSSGGILSAICAATGHGGTILMSRNCHKSAYHGVILNRLETAYVYPQIIEELGIQGGILASDVEKALRKNPDIQAVLIVSPTYDGIVSDIRTIADLAHGYGIPLIVDEAHGAHFPFGSRAGGFPVSALDCGADLVIQSLHKTLPSLTQTAVLHARRGYVDIDKLERYLQMFQTSSPSYVFMASMERCIYEMAEHGGARMAEFSRRLAGVRAELRKMRCLRLLECAEDRADASAVGDEVLKNGLPERAGVFDLDRSKLVVSCRNCVRVKPDGSRVRMDGTTLSDWLRTEFDLEMEMCGADYIVAITTCLDREAGLRRFVEALLGIDGMLERADGSEPVGDAGRADSRWELPDIRMKIAESMERTRRTMPLAECAGKISTEFVYLYPPGIPLVAPGELITEKIIGQILDYKRMGLPVQGMADHAANQLQVVSENR